MFQGVELEFLKEFLQGHYSTEFYLSEYAFPRQAALFDSDEYLLSPFLACFVATYDARLILKSLKIIHVKSFHLELKEVANQDRLLEIFNTKVLPYCKEDAIELYIEKTLAALKAHCEGAPSKLDMFDIIQAFENLLNTLKKFFPDLSEEKIATWQAEFLHMCNSLAGDQESVEATDDDLQGASDSPDNWFPLYLLARHEAKRSARSRGSSIERSPFNPNADSGKEKTIRVKTF